MLNLLLLRHAKSSRSDPELDDTARPLTARGREAAAAMGRRLAGMGLVPDLVLCSPARRARDTWKIAAAALGAAPRTLVRDEIYDFGNGGRLLEAIKAHGGEATTLLVVGHNPSMERLALRLAGTGDERLRQRMERKFPTAALAVICFDLASWDAIGTGNGDLQSFVRPRDLTSGKPG
ncbi:MAG: histidine phosphatase family protein [Alphaproteobacteria bacterium]|nr:histidine phosphatase family protein [Alphaproteobacteria bacterium]